MEHFCSVQTTTSFELHPFCIFRQTMKLLASKFISFLMKFCIIPVSFHGDKIQFKWFSWRTLVHIIFNFVVTIIISMIQYYLDPNVTDKVSNISGSAIARINMILWSVTYMFSLLFPIMLAKGFHNAESDLLTNERLCWPDKFWKVLIGQ